MVNNENLIPIPGRLHSVATEGHVTGADEIYDDAQQKNQATINSELIEAVGTGGSVDTRITNAVNVEKTRAEGAESTLDSKITAEQTRATSTENALDNRVDTLEEAVGTGGSVDSRITSAVATETSRAQKAESTLQSDITTEATRAQGAETELDNRVTTNESNIEALQEAYRAITQSQPIPKTSEEWAAMTSWEEGVVYRVQGTTSYADYMYNGTTTIKMAEYDNAIDDEPTAGSDNLVKSGGVFGKVDFDSLLFGQSNVALNIIRKVTTNFDFKTLKLTGIYNRNAYSAEIYANVIIMSAVLDDDTPLQFMYTANQGGTISTTTETITLSVTLGNFYTINLDVDWAGINCEKSLDVEIKKNEVNIINTINPSSNMNERGDEYVFGINGVASNIIHSVKTNFSFAHLYLTGIFNRNAGSSVYAQVIFMKAVLADGTNINFQYTGGLEGSISSQKEEITLTEGIYEIKLFVDWGGNNISKQGEFEVKKSSVEINKIIGTTFKYAQIGDSITYMYDNKYETSYDDRGTTLTGYKGTGYGRLICEHFGIPYDNHYPQGLNGRTFSDYYIEWNRGNISFPNNINLWTIFLGTNDYMTSSGAIEALGTPNDYINDTWTGGNLTVYGAIRKIVNKIRSQRTDNKQLRIVFITPFPLGVFCWGENEQQARETFQAASFTKQNGEYVWVSRGNTGKEKTLKDVVDAIKWVCSYEHFKCINLFDVSLMDMAEINTAQAFEDCGWTQQLYFAPSNFEFMRDGVHPNEKGHRIIGKRCIEELKDVFYDA